MNAENQEINLLNGDYRIYWNENDELPDNQYIKDLIGVRHIDVARKFWYGDVFIVRYSEHPKTFAYDVYDVPAAVIHWYQLEKIFRDMWEASYLEEELDRDRYFDAETEKRNADKEIIFQRMYVTTLYIAHSL